MRSARARGLRTLQHQSLPQRLCQAIDTEVWFRGLLLELEPADGVDRGWATKDQVYDEALAWYLAQRIVPTVPSARTAPLQDLTFWLDSRLLERMRRLAARHAVRPAQLIEQALVAYVEQHVPERLLAFRVRTQREATRLYHSCRAPSRRRRSVRRQAER